MSITVDYFFNHEMNLQALAQEVNGWIGCSLSPYEDNLDDYFSRFLGMELSVSKNGFENDGECNFEDYAYHLSIRTPVPLARLRGMQLSAVAFLAFALHADMQIAGMLVYDGQSLLARYEGRIEPKSKETELYDSVSGEFVRFPAHLETLRNRLPEHDWY